MKILAVNCGSSSLKFKMYEMPEEVVLISGLFERIGEKISSYTIKLDGEKYSKELELPNHKVAFEILVDELKKNNIIKKLDEIKGIGKVKKNQILKLLSSDDFKRDLDKLKLNDYQKEEILKAYRII